MEDDGGRYITKSLKVECGDVITQPMHSKNEKNLVFIEVWLIELCLIMAAPPPRIERGLP